ncbi:MAG: hypothetical protein Aurels2KO_37300 [Aureliella sp.]
MIALIALGAIEGSNKIFIRQAAVQAAYEAAKASAARDGTLERARQLALQVLSARNINSPTITFQPPRPDQLDPGTPFTVVVSVDGNERSVTGMGPFENLTIEARASMVKE